MNDINVAFTDIQLQNPTQEVYFGQRLRKIWGEHFCFNFTIAPVDKPRLQYLFQEGEGQMEPILIIKKDHFVLAIDYTSTFDQLKRIYDVAFEEEGLPGLLRSSVQDIAHNLLKRVGAKAVYELNTDPVYQFVITRPTLYQQDSFEEIQI